MTSSNQGVWVDSAGARGEVRPTETYKPAEGEVLLEVHAVAINPADYAQQATGLLINKYPYILGCDAAGVVVEVGKGVSRVSVGTRVFAQCTGTRAPEQAAFQYYAIAPELLVSPIPDDISFNDASVIPLALATATAGLYPKHQLGLPLPSQDPQPTGQILLIWGGSTSVGCQAIQLAVASGLEIITTSSPRNFELCKSLGAKHVFDYNSSSVVEDILAAVGNTKCAGAYDASGGEESMKMLVKILSSVGGGHLAPVMLPLKDLPDNVTSTWVNSGEFLGTDQKDALYILEDFLPTALKNGHFKPAPPAQVVGKGLESVQEGLDAWKRGVSAKKIVVEIK